MNTDRKVKIGLILIVSIIYLIAILADEYYVADWFTTDDAFYYFKVAENITQGLGSTFEGISTTNGYHPLWMIILIPIFSLSKLGLFVPLRMIILIQLLLALSTLVVFYNYLREHLSISISSLVSLMWVLLFPIFEVATNGTESALNGFALTLFWVGFSRFLEKTDENKYQLRKILKLGLLAVILVFSRLDNIFMITIFGLWLALSYMIDHQWKPGWEGLKILAASEIAYFVPTASSIGLYLFWNRMVTGSMMPLSGQIKRYWGQLPNTVYGSKVRGIGEFIAEMFSPDQGPWSLFFQYFWRVVDAVKVSYLFGTKTISLGILIIVGISFLLGFIISKQWKKTLQRIVAWPIIPLFLGTIVHFSYYKVFGHLATRAWYWVGGSFLIIIAAAVILENIFLSLEEVKGNITKFIPQTIVVIGAALILIPHIESSSIRLSGKPLGPHPYLQMSSWLETQTPPDSLVGMTGAGSTAYFVQNRVIMNLDGLVNGKEYFDQLRAGSAARYLEEKGVEYVFGNPYLMTETDPYQQNFSNLLENSEKLAEFETGLVLWKLDYPD